MIAPDDPRHGTTRGYAAMCRCQPCRDSRAKYERVRRKLRGLYGDKAKYSVDATGTRRRIEAMMWMGWRAVDIAAECGWGSNNAVLYVAQRQWVERATAEKIRAAFNRLGMTPGPSPETRKRAIRNGYVGPLAWDDIDTDEAPYTDGKFTSTRNEIDEVVVLRILNGERLEATKAEREEVVRRWIAMGRPSNELERRLGWKPERYGKRSDAA